VIAESKTRIKGGTTVSTTSILEDGENRRDRRRWHGYGLVEEVHAWASALGRQASPITCFLLARAS
jgi:hypothetical protein